MAASCSPRSGASNDILFVRVRSTWGVDLRAQVKVRSAPPGHEVGRKRSCRISFDSAGLPESIGIFPDSLAQFDRYLVIDEKLIRPL